MNAIKPIAQTKDSITLRRADFEALVQAAEDQIDLAAVRAHRAHEDRVGYEVARRDYLTGEETRRLLDGENPIRVWRKKRGMTQRALAQAARITPGYLAEIETGKKPGSAQALRRVAAALDLPMESVLSNPSPSR
jgi:DNA-binding XRE family transcriptional regulator